LGAKLDILQHFLAPIQLPIHDFQLRIYERAISASFTPRFTFSNSSRPKLLEAVTPHKLNPTRLAYHTNKNNALRCRLTKRITARHQRKREFIVRIAFS
jgi:hypothetical protein